MSWAIAGFVLIAVAVALAYLNRKTCRNAFSRGMQDAELPFMEFAKNYSGYFSPLKPMDAASYRGQRRSAVGAYTILEGGSCESDIEDGLVG